MNDIFEQLSGRFAAKIARSVSEDLASLAFSSPLSARNPDACLLWHPGYRERHKGKLFLQLCFSLLTSLIKGIVKVLIRYEPFGYALYGKRGEAILVVNSTCGFTTADGGYKTSYVCTDNDDALFVFGPIEKCGDKAKKVDTISIKEKTSLAIRLAKNGISAFFKVDGSAFDKTLLLLEWLAWVFGLQWLGNHYLERALSETIANDNIKKIGCIHEMHSYARVVWQVASRFDLKSFTVQHASLSAGKRWYFSYAEEKTGGLALPDVFYVFEERVSRLLAPHFERTKFMPSRSYRYNYLADIKPTRAAESGYYLFVAGIARFDNKVVTEAMESLLHGSGSGLPVRLRLHPHAQLDYRIRSWIKSEARKRRIELSTNTDLSKDIERSRVVIGMSSTVLEEAILHGRPVIQITNPDYLRYIDLNGIMGAKMIDYRNLSAETLSFDNVKVDAVEMRKRLGLDQLPVTYKQLFS